MEDKTKTYLFRKMPIAVHLWYKTMAFERKISMERLFTIALSSYMVRTESEPKGETEADEEGG